MYSCLPSALLLSSSGAAGVLSSSDVVEEEEVVMDKDSLFRFKAGPLQLSKYLQEVKETLLVKKQTPSKV